MRLLEVTDSRPTRRINPNSLEKLITPNLRRLTSMVEFYGFKLRIVGGAVRDLLLGRAPRDIDLLTDAVPDQIIFILEKEGLHAYTKGMAHGTIKVKFPGGEEYEITSIAFTIDPECCPPHLKVKTGGSWEEDAKRRDFTIDAMSVDLDGLMYDYLKGSHDLRKQTVKFIGTPEEQIKKDPVLILRFFRMLSMFREPKFDKGLLPMLREKMKLIKRVKPDRIQKELENIRKGPSGIKVRKMMKNLGFDAVISALKPKQDQVSEMVTRGDFNRAREPLLRTTPVMYARARDNKDQVIVVMPPMDFLNLTATPEEIQQLSTDNQGLRAYNKYTKMGDNSLMPFLRIIVRQNGEGFVRTHEGRHRASAVIQAGGKFFRVSMDLDLEGDNPKLPRDEKNKYTGVAYMTTAADLPPVLHNQYDRSIQVSTANWHIQEPDNLAGSRR